MILEVEEKMEYNKNGHKGLNGTEADMKLTFIGADHEVTGSCTLIEACGKNILVDCGLEQGKDTYVNCEIPVEAEKIDALFLTHAHIDHSGKIPALVKAGFNGPIYATDATGKLCAIMLKDSAHIQESEAEWKNRKAKRAGGEIVEPIYTIQDAEASISSIRSVSGFWMRGIFLDPRVSW